MNLAGSLVFECGTSQNEFPIFRHAGYKRKLLFNAGPNKKYCDRRGTILYVSNSSMGNSSRGGRVSHVDKSAPASIPRTRIRISRKCCSIWPQFLAVIVKAATYRPFCGPRNSQSTLNCTRGLCVPSLKKRKYAQIAPATTTTV